MKIKTWDLLNSYRSLVNDCRYHRQTMGSVRRLTSFPRIEAAVELWCRMVWWPLNCQLFGHDYESIADAENGSEDVWCNRCGNGFHAQF